MSQVQERPEFILFSQLSGISNALKDIVENDGKITKSTISYANSLRDYFLKCTSNEPLNLLPEIDKDSSVSDVYILICSMQYAIETLLSTEEKNSVYSSCAKWVGLASKAKDLIKLG